MNKKGFAYAVAKMRLTELAKAKALIYFNAKVTGQSDTTVDEICSDFSEFSLGAPNKSRLKSNLSGDKEMVRGRRAESYQIKADYLSKYEEKYRSITGKTEPDESDTILPLEIFGKKRSFYRKIANQINVTYDDCCYDATAVLMRRIVEVSLIEVYEAKGEEARIKGADGNYFMFNRIVDTCLQGNVVKLGRDSKPVMRKVKKLGDRSAHHARVVTRKKDIEKIKDGFRDLVEDILANIN